MRPGDSTWEQSLRLARELAARRARNLWAIADLAVRFLPVGTPDTVVTEWLCESGLDITAKTLRNMRFTAEAWPPECRVPGCSFTTHKQLAYDPHRFRRLAPGMTVHAAELARGARTTGPRFPDALRYLAASASYLRSAEKALSRARLNQDRLELLGAQIAEVEAELDELTTVLGMVEA